MNGTTTSLSPSDTSSSATGTSSYDTGQHRRTSGFTIGLAVATALGAVLLVLLVAGSLAVRSSGTSWEPQPLPLVEGAPPADLVMVVTERMQSGPEIDQQMRELVGPGVMQESAVVAGSPEFVASVLTPYGVHDMYRWTETATLNGRANGVARCFGIFTDHGGTQSCTIGDGTIADPSPSVGSSQMESQGQQSREMVFDQLPADAAWVVVTTPSGQTIAAAVIDGMAFVEWPSNDSMISPPPVTAEALDASMTPVWGWNG